ncbi:clathrin-mediated endocytosis regulator UBX3 KNAG_0A05760 [Huiozyma naganishii CBS 8797]|uniref:UBX domain-containing protein n=1 Tax=Huiozyma naganishii (strain ATCC MYA-139 / BCRC 22969 / CBS 8797 / KCTC 17520 / NBRC 10181 / NCYC 3082 / Yp74L-3) TaxID=1071383 RepID=J7S2L4_HUIN7|nr:hypothetical protein KNAG_0A05760 [Kazachstania naganishii CBS 8797]CCK68239.1 hypothetical protein KNAG_0A05760 [Kazachstania naganishii CBS 8797]
MPGGFPTEGGPTGPGNAYQEAQQAPHISGRQAGVIAMSALLQIPLLILYYSLTGIILLLGLIKPVFNFANMYNRKHKSVHDHATESTRLLEELSSQSVPSTEGAFTFGSVYNSESSVIPSNLVQQCYTDLLEQCISQIKFGLIYIHDPLVPNRMEFVEKILCSEPFINAVQTYQIFLWFGDITTPEGLQVANSLKIRHMPFIGVLSMKDNTRMELIGKYEGSLEGYTAQKFDAILAKAYPQLVKLAQKRQNREMERLIREQQDSRFRESLRHDQERDRQRNEAEERAQNEIQERTLKRQWLLWRKANLEPEPTRGLYNDACRVAIRLGDNSRITRSFSATLPIEEIYAFVELKMNNLLDSPEEDDNVSEPPTNYRHRYSFRLISPAPRQELDPEARIKDEPAIYPSGTVLFEALDDDA